MRILTKKINELRDQYSNVEIVAEGVTGGACEFYGRITALPSERKNLARIIRAQPDYDSTSHCLPSNYRVVFGAGVGGSRVRRAKQKEFALVKVSN